MRQVPDTVRPLYTSASQNGICGVARQVKQVRNNIKIAMTDLQLRLITCWSSTTIEYEGKKHVT